MHAQNKGSQSYIVVDVQNTLHGIITELLTLNEEKGGIVTFGDNAFARVVGKGMISLDDRNSKTHNILYVEGLKHIILNVSVIKATTSHLILKDVR